MFSRKQSMSSYTVAVVAALLLSVTVVVTALVEAVAGMQVYL